MIPLIRDDILIFEHHLININKLPLHYDPMWDIKIYRGLLEKNENKNKFPN